MIYFFHHYELPVILQQAQIQDILMRNQEGGGPPLRFTQRAATAALTNNNNAALRDNNLTANNNNSGGATPAGAAGNAGAPANGSAGGGPRREVTRAGGFNFAGFRFRFGIVLTTHQQRPQGAAQQPQPPGQPTQPPSAQQLSDQQIQETSNSVASTTGKYFFSFLSINFIVPYSLEIRLCLFKSQGILGRAFYQPCLFSQQCSSSFGSCLFSKHAYFWASAPALFCERMVFIKRRN